MSADSKPKTGVVAKSQVEKEPHKCPLCGSGHVIIEGKWQRRFRKEFIEGQERGVTMDDVHVERYTAINCVKCGARLEIEPDHILNLFTENMQLRMHLAEQRGQPVQRKEKTGVVM